MKRKPAVGPPPPRNATLNIRMRASEYEALREIAYSHKLMVSEWARGVLLREVADGK